jgi:hypothetical protein
MITTVEEAQHELQVAIEEVAADMDCSPDDIDIAHDMIVSVAWNIEDDDVAREFCRREIGWVPHDLEGRLGKKDWVV